MKSVSFWIINKKRFPLYVLKQTKTRLTGDRDKGHVINTLIQYIRSMNIDIIAEGVIEDDQLSVLSRAECIGYIISDENCGTDTDGIFVAGDCRTKAIRQVVTATADGASAALAACRYLDRM